jgi:TetR/AcrR family transcriptional regulator
LALSKLTYSSVTAAPLATKSRDAARSQTAILDAAERLFAERGFEATSLEDIGAVAGLSRGTPSYFFGSKERLYVAVLERLFAERQAATREAFKAVADWAQEGAGSLAAAFTKAVQGYLAFLLERPQFVRLVQREDLSGGRHLRAVTRESRAMTDTFEALRRAAPARGLRRFDVEDAVMLFVSLTFSPLTHRATFLAALERDLANPTSRRRHVAFVVDQLRHLVGGE